MANQAPTSSATVTAITAVNKYMFLTELTRLSFKVNWTYASVRILINNEIAFEQLYYPDEDGVVTMYDLDKMLSPYFSEQTVDLWIEVNGTNLCIGTTLIYCNTYISEVAQTFVPDFFLSPSSTERDICSGRIDMLTVIASEETSVDVLCTYYKDGATSTATLNFGTCTGVQSFIVNPEMFVNESLGALVGFTVQCGKRKQTYRMRKALPEADPMIIFRNCFNAWEVLYLTGAKTSEPSFSRSSTSVNGRYVTYEITEEQSFKAMTGPIRHGRETLYHDLARSLAVFIMDSNGNATDEITITETDLKFTNEDNTIADMTFTYRLTDKYNDKVVTVRPPRVFDKTFDEQFE